MNLYYNVVNLEKIAEKIYITTFLGFFVPIYWRGV